MAMTELGNGLFAARHYEDALSVEEAKLSLTLRIGASEGRFLIAQGNLAATLDELGRYEEALSIHRRICGTFEGLRRRACREPHSGPHCTRVFFHPQKW